MGMWVQSNVGSPGTAAKGVHRGDWSRTTQRCKHRLCHIVFVDLVPGTSNTLALYVRMWFLLAHSPHTNNWSIAEGQTGTQDISILRDHLALYVLHLLEVER